MGLRALVATGSFLVLALCSGCVFPAPHPYVITPGYENAPPARRVVLLPMNFVAKVPEGLEEVLPRVAERTAAYLESHGKEIVRLPNPMAESLWQQALAGTGESPSFDVLSRRFAALLREYESFDAIVVPSLALRQATIVQGRTSALWDGVQREFGVRNSHTKEGSVYVQFTFSGTIPALSLHLFVLDADGARMFESFGGLDHAVYADVAGTGLHGGRYRWQPEDEPLSDEALLDEGIGIAFDPYLPVLPAR